MNIKALKAAFPNTIPVLMGYVFLGIAYGVLLSEKGFDWWWAIVMGICVFGGSLQFIAINLMAAPFAPLQALLIALMVHARHIFYGFSMLEPFKKMGKYKPYLIYSLSDETYSLLCSVTPPKDVDEQKFFFYIAILDQSYWVLGSVIGAVAGKIIPFDSTGIDFAMTALFLVIFTEQWEKAKSKIPALSGILITLVSRIIFGANNFLVFAMIGIAIALILFRKQIEIKNREEEHD